MLRGEREETIDHVVSEKGGLRDVESSESVFDLMEILKGNK